MMFLKKKTCFLNLSFAVLFNFINLFSAMAQSDYDKMLTNLYQHTVQAITPEQFKSFLKEEEVILLDIRSQEEFSVSHLPEAQFIDYKSFSPSELDASYKNKKLVLYCSVGYRSEKAGEKLLAAGFKHVFNLYGGIFQWVNEENKLVNKKGERTDYVHTYNKKWSKWLEKGVKVYE